MLLTNLGSSSPTILNARRRSSEWTGAQASPRLRRWLEGISLWLAVLLFLFVHPLYAEASESSHGGHDQTVTVKLHYQQVVRGLPGEGELSISA